MAQYPLALAMLLAASPLGTGEVLQATPLQVSGPASVPIPKSPESFLPQQSTVPVVRMAQYPPLSLAMLVAEIPVGTGMKLHGSLQLSGPVLVPLPS